MRDSSRLYYAVVVDAPDLPGPLACFVTACSDLDAAAQAHRMLGATARFDLWCDGDLMLRQQVELQVRERSAPPMP